MACHMTLIGETCLHSGSGGCLSLRQELPDEANAPLNKVRMRRYAHFLRETPEKLEATYIRECREVLKGRRYLWSRVDTTNRFRDARGWLLRRIVRHGVLSQDVNEGLKQDLLAFERVRLQVGDTGEQRR